MTWCDPMTLKVGDGIAVSDGPYHLCAFRTVVKVFKNQIELDDGSRWSKNNKEIKKQYSRRRLILVEEANELNSHLIEERARGKMIRRLDEQRWRGMTTEQLEIMIAALDKVAPEPKEERPE